MYLLHNPEYYLHSAILHADTSAAAVANAQREMQRRIYEVVSAENMHS